MAFRPGDHDPSRTALRNIMAEMINHTKKSKSIFDKLFVKANDKEATKLNIEETKIDVDDMYGEIKETYDKYDTFINTITLHLKDRLLDNRDDVLKALENDTYREYIINELNVVLPDLEYPDV